jgi:hypothetical protein
MNKQYNDLINTMYAIGTQLYDTDRLLYDKFIERFGNIYTNFVYCTSEVDKIEQLKIIKEFKNSLTLAELIKHAIMLSDYYMLNQLKWMIQNYNETLIKYGIANIPVITEADISGRYKMRYEELKNNNLDSWRKSDDKILHSHYYYWINNLKDNETYNLWALQYNDTRIFNIFHLSSYGHREFPNIVLQYILDKHILYDQIEKDKTIEVISPFVKHGLYDGYKISTSANIGGFWYLIYLTTQELQEIYNIIGSNDIKKLNLVPFFAYVNSLQCGYKLDEKFYLYFKK